METVEFASTLAGDLLVRLPTRWRHVEAVAERARWLAPTVDPADRRLLLVAAYLHDIGYAEQVAETGFHNLDGARYLRELGHDRLAGLVAFHSAGAEEAELRGLAAELGAFTDEHSPVSRALSCCDLTTAGDGGAVGLDDRLADVRRRYGPQHVVTRSLTAALPRLRIVVADVTERIISIESDCGGQAMTG